MSVQYIFSIAGVFAVAHISIRAIFLKPRKLFSGNLWPNGSQPATLSGRHVWSIFCIKIRCLDSHDFPWNFMESNESTAGTKFNILIIYPLVNEHSYWKWPFTVEGWSQSNFLECGQTACGKVATTGSQQGHSNPSKHKGIAFIWRIQSTIITNTREPTPRTADYSSASTALHYYQSFCHNGLIWEGVRLSERRKQWKEKK